MTDPATQLAREIWQAMGFSEEGNVSAETFMSICESRGIALEPCATCHGDGGHESWCPEGKCHCCGLTRCRSDDAYDRAQG